MSIKIITDSTSDISQEEAKKLDVSIVPLKVIVGDNQYDEGVDISIEEFYPILESSKTLPTTSQPTPTQFLPYFEEAKKAGDDVIVLLLSSKISGTVQSATLAKNMAEYDRIHIIDTLNASMGLRLLVEYAVNMRAEGKTADEIVSVLDEARHRLVLLAMVDTLEYLQKGGRLGKGAATMGSLLRIKPIVTLNQGSLEMLAKARGLKNGNKILSEQIAKAQGLDPNVPVYLGYTRDKEQVMDFKAQAIRDHHLDKIEIHPVGCVIGTHTGPGAVILVFLKAK